MLELLEYVYNCMYADEERWYLVLLYQFESIYFKLRLGNGVDRYDLNLTVCTVSPEPMISSLFFLSFF